MLKAARSKAFKAVDVVNTAALRASVLLLSALLLPATSSAAQAGRPTVPTGSEAMLTHASVEVDVRAADGTALPGPTYVSLIKNDGKVFATKLAESGKVHFGEVPKSQLT